MGKNIAPWLLGYLAVGVAVATWTAQRGEAGQSHWTADSAPLGLLQNVLGWPYAAFVNLTGG